MTSPIRSLTWISTLVLLGAGSVGALAEMGSPARPGSAYGSIEGGYNNSDSEVTAPSNSTVRDGELGAGLFGAAAANGSVAGAADLVFVPGGVGLGALAVGNPGVAAIVSSGSELAVASTGGGNTQNGFDVEDGGHGGLTFGYVPVVPIGLINRFEVYGTITSNGETDTANGAIALRSVDNNAAIALAVVPVGQLGIVNEVELRTREFGLRLKSDQKAGGATITFSAESFFIRYEQNADTSATLNSARVFSASREGDLDADLYGLQAAIEAVVPLFGPVSLVGRGTAGGYIVDADASFTSTFRLPNLTYDVGVSDGDRGTGYRLGAEAGARYAMSASSWLTVTGAVDYFSEAPTMIFPGVQGDGGPASIDFDDLLNWRVGARLTMAAP